MALEIEDIGVGSVSEVCQITIAASGTGDDRAEANSNVIAARGFHPGRVRSAIVMERVVAVGTVEYGRIVARGTRIDRDGIKTLRPQGIGVVLRTQP